MNTKAHFIGMEEVTMKAIVHALQEQGHSITTCTPDLPTASIQHVNTNHSCQKHSREIDDKSPAAVVVGRNVDKHHEAVKKSQQVATTLYSYPAYLQAYATDKQRIVVIGNEEILAKFFAILIHVMNYWKRAFDYATLFTDATITPTVHLSDAPLIFLQGDITPFSNLDTRIVASIYQPHIVVMLDIPQYTCDAQAYESPRTILQHIADDIPKAGKLIYNKEIADLCTVGVKDREDVASIPFQTQVYKKDKRTGAITTPQGAQLAKTFTDDTSLQALAGVATVLQGCAITLPLFYEAIQSYAE